MFQNYLTILQIYSGWTILLFRLAFAGVVVVQGWAKIKHLRTTGENFAVMGFKPGRFWGTVVACAEFFGGLALVLGLFTQVVGIVFTIQFLVIVIWRSVRGAGFRSGIEFDFLLLGGALLLATLGGGHVALDRFFFR